MPGEKPGGRREDGQRGERHQSLVGRRQHACIREADEPPAKRINLTARAAQE